jgi:nucleoside permease NupC
VIVGLVLQQSIALFVLKTGAGFAIFNWLANLASDFLSQSLVGALFFFDADTISKHWFFVNTVRLCQVFSVTSLTYSMAPYSSPLPFSSLHSCK